MATIILLCNENYAVTVRQILESTRKQLLNGELSPWAWSAGKQAIAKVGDRVYIQRTNTYPPAGYFASGYVVSAQPNEQLKSANRQYANLEDCYRDEFFDRKYIVQIFIDSVIDYDSPLRLNDLEQREEFEEAGFFIPEGHAFDAQYAKALNKAWEEAVQQRGVSIFTVLSGKGHKYKEQKDYVAALQVYKEALEIAKSVGDLSWIKFFGTKIQQCQGASPTPVIPAIKV